MFKAGFLLCLILILHASLFAQGKQLAIDSAVTISVNAWDEQTTTGLTVNKGEIYVIKSSGTWADNGYPATDANGFKPFKPILYVGTMLKILPNYNYMLLGLQIGRIKLPLGVHAKIVVPKTGELFLFPNDAKGFFDNNKGTLSVQILRVR